MKKTASLYFLYCLNRQCRFSIYQLMVELRIPLTDKNLNTSHICTCCKQRLVSSMGAHNQHIVADTKFRLLVVPKYLNN